MALQGCGKMQDAFHILFRTEGPGGNADLQSGRHLFL